MNEQIERLEPRRLLAAGDLYPSFGDGGVVLEPTTAWVLHVNDSEVLPGDNILIAGEIAEQGEVSRYLLRRFNADGSPDETFGAAGSVTGRLTNNDSAIIEFELTTDGKIVALVDDTPLDDGPTTHFLARFNADGSLDETFSNGGFVELLGAVNPSTLAVQPDGGILLAQNDDVTRYTAAGDVDQSFGSSGTAQDTLAGMITTIHPLPGGTILVGGIAPLGESDSRFALAKLDAAGDAVASFGDNGKALTDVHDGTEEDPSQVIHDLVVLSDGRIVASGSVISGTAAVRYQSNGQVDASFGDNGRRTIPDFFATSRAFADPDGGIVLARGDAAVRLSSTGDEDMNFGRVLGAGGDEGDYFYGDASGLLSNGRLIVAGERAAYWGLESIVVFARLTADDGNPSPIQLTGRTVSVTGTSDDDHIFCSGASTIAATLNGFGRSYDASDVDQVHVAAGSGNDRIVWQFSGSVPCHFSGGPGSDKIFGSGTNDTLEGNGGRDFIDGWLGADVISGGAGNDQLRGQGGADHLYGRGGDDFLMGNGGDDLLVGGAGADTIHGGDGDDSAADDEEDELSPDIEQVIT